MKNLVTLGCLGLVFAVSTPAFSLTQQQRMKGCSMEAKGLKGAERKAFMSKCLKKDYALKAETEAAVASADPSAGAARQQEKMKNCSAEAKSKGLKGADRKMFMSTCLKG